jgi:hypothetical protein
MLRSGKKTRAISEGLSAQQIGQIKETELDVDVQAK